MKELLEAGVHFGHQTKRWNPKMKEYIFGERNGIYIIDLQKTLKMFKDAARFVGEMAAQGKNVLFVGTKRQAQEAIAEEAMRCQMYYVNQRWLGGLLTNMATVQKSIKRLKELEAMATAGRRLRRPSEEGSHPAGARAQAPGPEPGRHQGYAGPAGRAVRDRFQQGSHRREGSAAAGHSGGGHRRHQLRSRRSGLGDSRQRRRAARHPPVRQQDCRRGDRRPALATEQDFAADKIVQDETPAEEGMLEYTEYVDPKYAEKIMAESLSMEEDPAPDSPRKGPASETAEPVPEPAVEPKADTKGCSRSLRSRLG